uniref:Uncharacterized protein n=1 Tax=Amphimedon queenslandica TaxID=400682 RepID=A0A1X7V5F6_AMPQE
MLAILLNDTTCISTDSGGGQGGSNEIQLSEVALPCPCSSMSHQRYRKRSLSSFCINESQSFDSQCGNSAPSTIKTATFTLIILQPIITILILFL